MKDIIWRVYEDSGVLRIAGSVSTRGTRFYSDRWIHPSCVYDFSLIYEMECIEESLAKALREAGVPA